MREHARELTQRLALQVILINKAVLGEFRVRGPEALLEFCLREASETMRVKRVQIARPDAG